MREGVCENFGNCDLANHKQRQQIEAGEPFKCRDCKLDLAEIKEDTRRFPWKYAAIVFLIILAALGTGAGVYIGFLKPHNTVAQQYPNGNSSLPEINSVLPVPTPSNPASIPEKRPTERRTLLRLAGSNTIGSELAPTLAKEYLVSRGAAHVEVKTTADDEKSVTADLGDDGPVAIKIAAHGTVTGFKALMDGTTDIGDASRQMHSDEEVSLRSKEIARSFGSEYVIGLDGIAVIVNRGNPVGTLSVGQLGRLFAGKATSWGDVGGPPSWPVHLYARNKDLGTWETFDQIVLQGGKEKLALLPTAERIEDSATLSDKVAADPYGIGFIGLPYVRSAKAVSVSAVDRAFYPTLFTVRTETYPLSRRLYMYAPRANANAEIARFLQFVASTAGQKIVEATGFVSLDVTPPSAPEMAEIIKNLPVAYRKLFDRIGAHTMFTTTIHFRTDSSIVDSKGKEDFEQILGQIQSQKLSPQDLVLIGHADGTGPHSFNCTLSQGRAKAVAEELAAFGLSAKTIVGFCETAPVAPNDTEDGREKNRRVEIWRPQI